MIYYLNLLIDRLAAEKWLLIQLTSKLQFMTQETTARADLFNLLYNQLAAEKWLLILLT